jgi:hypothetical protein
MPTAVVPPKTTTPIEAAPIIAATPQTGAEAETPAAQPQPAAGQGHAQAAARTATPGPNTAPDIRADVAVASSGGSTSGADAMAAARAAIGTPAPAATTQVTTPAALQAAPPVAVQVYTRFVERFDGRAQRFEVSLQPAELGRVDVRIEIGADRKVHAVLAAHDSNALGDLMRGQRSLERALSDAGVDLAKDGLKFELSQDAGRNAAGWHRGNAWADRELAHAWRAFTPVDVPVEASPADISAALRPYSRSSRLDLVA